MLNCNIKCIKNFKTVSNEPFLAIRLSLFMYFATKVGIKWLSFLQNMKITPHFSTLSIKDMRPSIDFPDFFFNSPTEYQGDNIYFKTNLLVVCCSSESLRVLHYFRFFPGKQRRPRFPERIVVFLFI